MKPSSYTNIYGHATPVRYPSFSSTTATPSTSSTSSTPSSASSAYPSVYTNANAYPSAAYSKVASPYKYVYEHHHYPQQPQHQQQYGRAASMYAPLTSYTGSERRRHSWCTLTLKLVIFHVLNAVLGMGGFLLIVVGTSLSLGLVPLGCVGLVLFRVVLFLVGFLAELDVGLYNYIAPVEQHVYVRIPHEARLIGLDAERLSPGLSSFSPLALMATVYFATVKLALGLLSGVCAVVAVGLPMLFCHALAGDKIARKLLNRHQPHGVDVHADPVGFTVIWLSLFMIGVALLHVVARASRAATRFFCCERFSTYRYVQEATTGYPRAATSYGSDRLVVTGPMRSYSSIN